MINIDREVGRVLDAEFISSPNFNERPEGTDVSLLVIHNISLPPGKFGNRYIQDFFTNQLDRDKDPYFETIADRKLSTHLFIDRKGKIVQFVPFQKRAWHAGESEFAGKKNCNDFSIGIELEGTDDEPYETEQYESLVNVTKALLKAYPRINLERIVGHEDIAPGRKTDPGPFFDWKFYKRALV